MRLTFLPKTIGTIGLIATLAVVVTTGKQQTAQAQMNINVPAEIDDGACIASGFHSFYQLQNINLSYEQMERIFALEKLQSVVYERLINGYPAEDDLSGGYAFVVRPGAEITPEVSAAIDAATRDLTLGEALVAQIAELNEQFGQYGEFGVGKRVLLTPEQRTAEVKQLKADFDARYISVLTPQQQRQYQENLVTKSKINEACGIVSYDRSNDNIFRGFEPETF